MRTSHEPASLPSKTGGHSGARSCRARFPLTARPSPRYQASVGAVGVSPRGEIMSRLGRALVLVVLSVAGPLGLVRAHASPAASVERIYVMACGENRTEDVSAWSPGVNVGQPRVFSNHCYLIRHPQGWLLWDTGNADAIAAHPDGVSGAGGRLLVRMPKTLASQLKELGVDPMAIKYLALSHMHRSEEHTSELQSLAYLVCRLLLEKKKKTTNTPHIRQPHHQ